MNLILTVNKYIENNFDGLDFLVRDKNTFHARDASVAFKTPFPKDELILRKKHKLALEKVEGKCLRALFYDFQRQQITNPMEANSIRTMDVGSAVEEVEKEYYKAIGVYHSSHVRMFNKEYQISGETDVFIWEYEDILNSDGTLSGKVKICIPARLIGIEIKSFYGYYAEKEILEQGIPKWNHFLQSLVYLDHYKPNIPYWLLVYLSRSGGIDTKLGRVFGRQFKIQLSKMTGDVYIDGVLVKDFTMNDVNSRFKKAQFFIDNNKIPDRDYVYNYPAEIVELKMINGEVSKRDYAEWSAGKRYISDWQCQYCSYLYECWKNVYGDKVRGAIQNKKEEVKEKAIVQEKETK